MEAAFWKDLVMDGGDVGRVTLASVRDQFECKRIDVFFLVDSRDAEAIDCNFVTVILHDDVEGPGEGEEVVMSAAQASSRDERLPPEAGEAELHQVLRRGGLLQTFLDSHQDRVQSGAARGWRNGEADVKGGEVMHRVRAARIGGRTVLIGDTRCRNRTVV